MQEEEEKIELSDEELRDAVDQLPVEEADELPEEEETIEYDEEPPPDPQRAEAEKAIEELRLKREQESSD